MATQLGAQSLVGHRLLDRDGNSIGKIGHVYFDEWTETPRWITVRTGLFGTNENIVPLKGAQLVDDEVQVPYHKSVIKNAPSFSAGQHLQPWQENTACRHYELQEIPEQRGSDGRPHRRGKHARIADPQAQNEAEFTEFLDDLLAERRGRHARERDHDTG